jgi:hypothetical protein
MTPSAQLAKFGIFAASKDPPPTTMDAFANMPIAGKFAMRFADRAAALLRPKLGGKILHQRLAIVRGAEATSHQVGYVIYIDISPGFGVGRGEGPVSFTMLHQRPEPLIASSLRRTQKSRHPRQRLL